MRFTEYMEQVDVTNQNIRQWYGDFGIELVPMWSNDGYTVVDFNINWPALDESGIEATYRFAEALSAATYEAAKMVGTVVED